MSIETPINRARLTQLIPEDFVAESEFAKTFVTESKTPAADKINQITIVATISTPAMTMPSTKALLATDHESIFLM